MEKNISVERAEELIVANAASLEPERIELASALNRVLRERVLADEDSPRFDCSAVDGYALRRADAERPLKLIGEIQAGVAELPIVREGECARIFTGAQIPPGADYVAMQEDVTIQRHAFSGRNEPDQLDCLNQSSFSALIAVNRFSDSSNIRRKGENCRRRDVVVAEGARLCAAELAAIANCGVTRPLVTRAARVVHFVSGNELVGPGEKPGGTQLRDTNSTLVAAFLRSLGAELVLQQRLGDSLDEAKRAIDSLGRHFDLLLVSGGASVGDYDFAAAMLQHGGFEMQFESVNLRPGKPLKLFTRGTTIAFAIPGNPVSHWVILHLFIAPLLRAWSGLGHTGPSLIGSFAEPFSQKPNRRETHLPAIATPTRDGWRLRAKPFTSSGDTSSLVGANGLVQIPAGCAGFSPGDPVSFRLCQSFHT